MNAGLKPLQSRSSASEVPATRASRAVLQQMLDALRVGLELGRVSNLPTCVTNVFVGYLWIKPHLERGLLLSTLVVCLLYIGGMTLNDYTDRHLDARERPGRPIPSGRISAERVLLLTVGLFFLALGLAFFWVPGSFGSAVLLAALIVTYNLLHHRWEGIALYSRLIIPLLMGSCRGMILFVAADAALGGRASLLPLRVLLHDSSATDALVAHAPNLSLPFVALALLLWVAALTAVAQEETLHSLSLPTTLRALCMIGLAALCAGLALFIALSTHASAATTGAALLSRPLACLVSAVLFLAWLRWLWRARPITPKVGATHPASPGPKPLSPFALVMSLLASISLLDAVFLSAAIGPWGAAIGWMGFLATRRLQRRISGV